MNVKKKLNLLVAGLLAVAVNTVANNPEKQDSLILLKEVVVTANKIMVNKNNVPLSISVIERDEIQNSSESALLPVLTHRVPSLFVTQKGITGFGLSTNGAGSVKIRGIGGNQVLMLFDGQPQWAGVFGHSLPDTYVASDIERVEVIRGPGSLLYGSNAMGGVVNIISRKQKEDGRNAQVRVMYGSFNTQKYMINNGFNAGRFSSFVSINHDRTDGHRANSEFHITNGFANLGYKLNENYQLKGDVSIANYRTHDPGPDYDPLTDHIIKATRGKGSISITNSHEIFSGAAQFFYNWGRHEINDGYSSSGQPRKFLFNSSDHNMGILVYETVKAFEGNTLTFGMDYKNWGGHAWNDTINGTIGEIVDKSVNEVAGYLIAQQNLFNILSINAGIRYENSGAYGNKLTPQAGITLRPFEGNSIKLSYSNGYRSPNIRELYISYPPYSIANPDLKPESINNYEFSITQRIGEQFSAEATLFYLDAKDLISTVNGKLTNINTLHNKGSEFEISYYPLRNLSFTANYSLLKTSIPIEAAPENKFFIEGTYRINRLSLSADVESIGGLVKQGGLNRDGTVADGGKVNYTLINAKASYLFGQKDKGANIFIKGENLTAAKYEIIKGFIMPKAAVMGGIEVSF
jgi:iron complex outermembrane receptor protein